MKLILALVLLLFLSCGPTRSLYLPCKNNTDIEECIKAQLKKNQKIVSFERVDIGLYEVIIRE